jgi:hypothetical protein
MKFHRQKPQNFPLFKILQPIKPYPAPEPGTSSVSQSIGPEWDGFLPEVGDSPVHSIGAWTKFTFAAYLRQ